MQGQQWAFSRAARLLGRPSATCNKQPGTGTLPPSHPPCPRPQSLANLFRCPSLPFCCLCLSPLSYVPLCVPHITSPVFCPARAHLQPGLAQALHQPVRRSQQVRQVVGQRGHGGEGDQVRQVGVVPVRASVCGWTRGQGGRDRVQQAAGTGPDAARTGMWVGPSV